MKRGPEKESGKLRSHEKNGRRQGKGESVLRESAGIKSQGRENRHIASGENG